MPISKSVVKVPTIELDTLRESLVEKRAEVLALYRHDVQVGQQSNDQNSDDFADRANNSYNRETMFALSNNERELLFEIDEALDRFDNDTFGLCTHCKSQIGKARLQAIAWAKYCIDCQELHEKGMLD